MLRSAAGWGTAEPEGAQRQIFSAGQIEASAVEIAVEIARQGGLAILFLEECPEFGEPGALAALQKIEILDELDETVVSSLRYDMLHAACSLVGYLGIKAEHGLEETPEHPVLFGYLRGCFISFGRQRDELVRLVIHQSPLRQRLKRRRYGWIPHAELRSDIFHVRGFLFQNNLVDDLKIVLEGFRQAHCSSHAITVVASHGGVKQWAFTADGEVDIG